MKKKVHLLLTVSFSAIILTLSLSTALAYDARVLLYYGNGGMSPTSAPFYTLEQRYNDNCYPVDYTDQWPARFSSYVLVFLIAPG